MAATFRINLIWAKYQIKGNTLASYKAFINLALNHVIFLDHGVEKNRCNAAAASIFNYNWLWRLTFFLYIYMYIFL